MRFVLALISVIGLVGLTGCPKKSDKSGSAAKSGSEAAKSGSEPAKSGAGDSGKTDAVTMKVDHVKKGQKYTYEMEAGGQKMKQVWEVVDKNDEEITYRVDTVMTIMDKENVTKGTDTKFPIKPKAAATTGDKPAEAPKPIGEETIEVGGVKFDCKIYENSGTKTWTFMGFPSLIKMDGATKMVLKSIE